MKYDLSKIGIEKGLKYECIYTTENSKGEKNAGPFGFTYLGEDKVFCNLFEGTTTLKNILETNKYYVNITQDPLIFTYSTIGNLPEEYFDEKLAIIKDVPAYLEVEVEEVKKEKPENFPIDKDDNYIYLITGKITDFKINNSCARGFNRGISSLIECLVNYTRYDMVEDEMKEYYENRLDENQRIINKVSDSQTQKAIELLRKEMLEK